MTGYSTVPREIDEVQASILAQVIRRDYLEQMLKKAKLLELTHGADYPRNMSEALQDLMNIESQRRK